jgi:hypothetical protein
MASRPGKGCWTMGVSKLLAEARQHGVQLILTPSGTIKARAPKRPPPDLLAKLRAHRAELILALRGPEPERAGWDVDDWRTFLDERAAIREYDGHLPRAEAERLAWAETLAEWHRAHGVPPPSWQCAGCGKPLSGAPAMTLADAARVHDVAGYGCLIAYGKRWRAAAENGLAEMGITPPGEALGAVPTSSTQSSPAERKAS